jgi:peroxin-1
MGTSAIACFAPLRNALINVPPKMEQALTAANTLAQNIVIQLSWKDNGRDKSAYVGWTGISCRKTASPVGARKNDNMAMFDIDPAFASNVGLREGTKVQLTVHPDVPVAYTVHVEPLTANDWEIMVIPLKNELTQELHPAFLELNLINQIRAVTPSHPTTIYLSMTSSAVITVTQIEPPLSDPVHRPFAILSPSAEIIVAPKLRPSTETNGPVDVTGNRNSIASTSKSRKPKRKGTEPSMLLRTVCLPHKTFKGAVDEGLCVYVDPYIKASALFSGGMCKVSVLGSPGRQVATQEKKDDGPGGADTELMIARQVVVKVLVWEDAPANHVGISPSLAATLGIQSLGDIAK